jgi:peptidoglycan/xylan/chitin deacetylase (PgdA/CDA1 family)
VEDRLVLLRELFCEPAQGDPVIVPVHAAIGEYMKRLEIDRRFFPLAVVVMMVDHAIGRLRRAQTLDRRSASGRAKAALRKLEAENRDLAQVSAATRDVLLREWDPIGRKGVAVKDRHRNDYVEYIGALAKWTDSLFPDRSLAATSGGEYLTLSDERGQIDGQARADRRMSVSIPILMYHEVTPRPPDAFRKYAITPRTFARQMRWLASEGYNPISLQDLLDARINHKRLPPRPVILTFDDGYRECVQNAVPILKEHGFTATFYIVAGLVGKTSGWLVKERGVELALADWSSIRELHAAGLELGSHGMTHVRLTGLSSAECREELLESRQLLQDRLGCAVRDLAYPFGHFDDRIRALAEGAGYRSACSVRIGLSSLNDDLFALTRVPINGDESLPDFICRLHTARAVRRYFRDAVRGVRRHLQRGVDASP